MNELTVEFNSKIDAGDARLCPKCKAAFGEPHSEKCGFKRRRKPKPEPRVCMVETVTGFKWDPCEAPAGDYLARSIFLEETGCVCEAHAEELRRDPLRYMVTERARVK